MSRKALQLIVALVLLSVSTTGIYAQIPATVAQKFTIRNAAGESIVLTSPSSGVTPYTLTFPATTPSINGQVLTASTSGVLSWTSSTSGTVTNFSAGDLTPLFTTTEATTTTTPALTFNLNTQQAGKVFAGPVSGPDALPTFRALTGSDITGNALTKTDDANVTLTLGGSPSTALLNAASLTLGWTGLLSIARGGTNSSATPTSGAVAYGTGTAYGFTAAGLANQVLISNGASAPSWANANSLITGSALTDVDDANVTITLGGTPGTALLQPVSITAGWSGVLSTARGGTGLSTIGTANQVLSVNGAGTALTYANANSLVTGSALTDVDDANVTITLGGTPGTALLQPVSITAGWSGVLSTARGGTGLSTIGSANQVLAVNGAGTGLTYVNAATGTVTNFSAGDLTPLFTTSEATTTTTPALSFNLNTQQAGKVFAGPVSGPDAAPTFRALTGSDITGAALTKTDDANVTLTLGGTPATALLNAASLTLGWTGQLSIARGGTNGTAAPTSGAVAYGTGTAYGFTAAGSANQVLISNGASAPSWANANSVVTGAALTKTDDANVTLTLGGTPGTALLNATSLTLGWNGVLSTTRGGTGLSTIGSANQVLAVNGAGTALTYVTLNNGTVTNFTAGNLSPLFTTNVATPTTTPDLSFTLSNQAANTVFAGPAGGGPAAPTFRALTGSDITGAALTDVDDANVTLSLTGAPGSALLNATTITAGWNGQLSIARGGTGASTAAAALNNLLPSQAGNAGEFLTTDGAGTVTWSAVTAANAWNITGNTGTTAGTNFIGTTDNVDFVVKTNDAEAVRVDATGQVGFGRSTPDVKVDIDGGMIWRPDTVSLLAGATHSGGANIRHDNVSIGDRSYIYISDTATYYGNRITGFTDGYNGKLLRVFNSTHTTLTLVVDDANSSAANRIRNTVGDNGNVGIADSGFADLIYDGETQKWLIHSVTGPTSTASSGFTYFARKTADQTLTSAAHGTTLQDASGMSINIFPDIVHTVDGMFYFTSPNSNVDVQVAFEMTGGTAALSKITILGHSDGGANVVDGSDILPTDGSASATINVTGGTEMFIHVAGMFINGPSNANLQVRFKRVGGSSDLVMKQGSYLRLIPVGVN